MDLVLLRLRGDGAEEGDVVVGVEAAEVEVAVAGGVRAEHSHRGVRASARRLRLSPAADRAVDGRAVLQASEGKHRQGVSVLVVGDQESSCCHCCFTGLHAGEA